MRLPTAVLLLLGAALSSAEPILTGRLHNPGDLPARWAAGPWSLIASDPAAAPLRARLFSMSADLLQISGLDLAAWLTAADLQLRIDPAGLAHGDDPTLHLQVDLGSASAAVVMGQAREVGMTTLTEGADEAAAVGDCLLARFGATVAWASAPGQPRPWTWLPAPVDADVALTVDLGAAHEASNDGPLRDLLGKTGTLRWQARCNTTGLHETWRCDRPWAGAVPVDRSVVAKLPPTAVLALAIGVDGPALAAAQPALVRDLLTELLGGDVDPASLLAGMHGTLAIAIAPGLPIPAVTLAIPRSPGLDARLGSLCKDQGMDPPVDGGHTVISIPDLGLPLTVARDSTHWVVSTDLMAAATWGAEGAGGLDAAPTWAVLATAPADAQVLAISDGPGVLRMAAQWAPQGLNLVGNLDMAEKGAITRMLSKLAAKAGPGWCWIAPADGGWQADIQGLGGSWLLPFWAWELLIEAENSAQHQRRPAGKAPPRPPQEF